MNEASDATHDAYHAWWEQDSPTAHTHHVVHGTRSSIEALQKKLAEVERLQRLVDAALNCDPAIRPVEWVEWRERAAALQPLRVEDLLDGLPRVSTESEAVQIMGDGQALVKMREINK